jgi:HAD superfamily hydrolase (TIGR01509 family)
MTVPTDADLNRRDRALQVTFPELTLAQCRALGDALTESANAAITAGIQHTDEMTAEVLHRLLPGLGRRARDARDTMASGWLQVRPFQGAQQMLQAARELGLATVLVSNASWPSAELYRRRLMEMDLAEQLDAIVSSVDVGVRKPDRRIFDVALQLAGQPAEACVMVGDSETRDIEPAVALGMRTIRVTMQYPLDGPTLANAVASSPTEVATLLERWIG